MHRARCEHFEKFPRTDADLVEIPAITELQAARHHVNVETLQVFVSDIGCRIGDHRETAGLIMAAVRLTTHVVDFFGTDFAVLAANAEHLVRIVDMHMHFGLALGAGKQQRVAE